MSASYAKMDDVEEEKVIENEEAELPLKPRRVSLGLPEMTRRRN